MTKKQVVKIMRNVMTGADAHTNIVAWKEGRSWKVETGLNKYNRHDFENVQFIGRHCCNEMTLKEAEELLKNWN